MMGKIVKQIKKQNAGLLFGVLFALYSIYYFIKSFSYPYTNRFGVGPGFFPRWTALLSIIASVAYIFSSLFIDKGYLKMEDIFPPKKELINVVTVILAILGYILIINFAGFGVATILLLLVIFLRSYSWWKSILYAMCIAAVVFAIFKVGFSVPIPMNSLGF
jgi:hypothetical protein